VQRSRSKAPRLSDNSQPRPQAIQTSAPQILRKKITKSVHLKEGERKKCALIPTNKEMRRLPFLSCY